MFNWPLLYRCAAGGDGAGTVVKFCCHPLCRRKVTTQQTVGSADFIEVCHCGLSRTSDCSNRSSHERRARPYDHIRPQFLPCFPARYAFSSQRTIRTNSRNLSIITEPMAYRDVTALTAGQLS